jgi:hypothetical protein
MAARKSFLRTAPQDEQFDRLLADAARAGVTEEQLREQRVSFAYGNAPADSKNSKASVREASKHNLLVPA